MRQVIHIPDSKVDVIEHLKGQLNMSGYVVSLIEKDIENKLLTKEEIIKLIKRYSGKKEEPNLDLIDSIEKCLEL